MAIVTGAGADARIRERVGAELYARQRANRHFCAPVCPAGYFIAFCATDVRAPAAKDERVLVYAGKDELVVASESDRINGLFQEIRPETSPVQALTEFMSALTYNDVDALEAIENDINTLDDALVSSKKPIRTAIARIVALRRALLGYKRYYEQLDTVLERLIEDGPDVFTQEEEAKLVLIERRVSRLIDAVSHLREGVTQAREAYQAQIDIEQNQIMKVFTVITAVFLPLTLIVGWYGMNFPMPEYAWRGGYAYVSVLSAVVCALLFLFFRRKKWF